MPLYIALGWLFEILVQGFTVPLGAAHQDAGQLGVALFEGGKQMSRHDTDHDLLFRQARIAVLAW